MAFVARFSTFLSPFRLMILALFVAGIVFVIARNTIPNLPADLAGRIAYTSDEGGNYAVYIMDADGGNRQQLTLTADEQTSLHPLFSPDGRQLLVTASACYTCLYDVLMLDIATGGTRTLTQNLPAGNFEDPQWSPDGRHILVVQVSAEDTLKDIYLIDAQTLESRNLSADHPGDDFAPRWSPDGEQIAFISDRAGYHALWLMDGQGQNPRPLTADADLPMQYSPNWSPDGRQLSFVTDHLANADIRSDVYVIDADGDNLRAITRDEARNFAPLWSPNGRIIAYQTLNDDGTTRYEIYDIRTGDTAMLADGIGDAYGAIWSPDGAYLLFTLNRQLVLVAPDAPEIVIPFTRNDAVNAFPAWQR